MSYTKPGTEIYLQYTETLSLSPPDLYACIIGPRYDFYLYTTDKSTISLGAYDNSVDTAYSYPGLAVGNVVDQTGVDIYFDDLQARYFSKATGAGTYEFKAVAGTGNANKVTTNGTQLVFKSYTNSAGTSYARSAIFGTRDVQIGDYAYLFATVGTLQETLAQVTGFVNDTIPAVTLAASASATNHGTQVTAVAAAAAAVGNINANITGTSAAGTYPASYPIILAGGNDAVDDTYTITIDSSGLPPCFGNQTTTTTPFTGPGVGNTGACDNIEFRINPATYESAPQYEEITFAVTISALPNTVGTTAITMTYTNSDGSISGTVVLAGAGGYTGGWNVVDAALEGLEIRFAVGSVLTMGNSWSLIYGEGKSRNVRIMSTTDVLGDRLGMEFGFNATAGYSGTIGDIYTVTCTATAGAPGTAIVDWVAVNGGTSGTVTTSVAGTATAIGTDGLEIIFNQNLVAADTWEFAVEASDAYITATTASLVDTSTTRFPGYGIAMAVGVLGSTITYTAAYLLSPVMTATDYWTYTVNAAVTAEAGTSAGTYIGDDDTTYKVEVTTGGIWGTAQFTAYDVTNGVDPGCGIPIVVSASATAIDVGSYGVTIAFTAAAQAGLIDGSTWYISATSAKLGAYKTILLSEDLDADLIAGTPDLNCNLRLVQEDKLINEYRVDNPADTAWTTSTTQITLKDAIYVSDSSWAVNIPVIVATAYSQYRALNPSDASVVSTISSSADIATYCGSSNATYNPLGYAATKVYNSIGGNTFKVCSIITDNQAGYTAAREAITKEQDIAYLAPLTYNATIHSDFSTYVSYVSGATIKKWKTVFLCKDLITSVGLYTTYGVSSNFTCTITDDGTGAFSLLTASASDPVDFVADGVVLNDEIRTNYAFDLDGNVTYDTYTVSSVTSAKVLVLVEDLGAAVAVAQKFELYTPYSLDEQANYIANYSTSIDNYLVRNVWPDVIDSYPGYYLAACLAAQRASVPPHLPLTNYSISGFTDASRSRTYFTETQLNTIAEGGTWIVTQDSSGGSCYTRHQLTTDMSTLNYKEDSIVSNAHSIAYYLRDIIDTYVVSKNIIVEALSELYSEISGGLEDLKGEKYTNYNGIGSQLVDYTVDSLGRSDTVQDEVDSEISVTVPTPWNVTKLTITI